MKTTLKERIDAEIKQAMIERNNIKKEILKVIKSEISREEAGLKIYEDKEVAQLIRKTIKNLETINNEQSKQEIEILNSFIPALMTEEQVKTNVSSIITEIGASGMKDMGKVMGAFKVRFDGQADNNVVSKFVKELLN